MTAEDAASQEFVDREIGHLREELRHLKEMWEQQVASDAAALILRTAEVEKEMLGLNHAHKAAREIAATTVDSKSYEVRMAELQVQLQAIKDTAQGALLVAIADLSRQVQTLTATDQTNKDEAASGLMALDRRVSSDIDTRAGAVSAVAEVAKKASARALLFGIIGATCGVVGLLLGIATFALRFYASDGGTP